MKREIITLSKDEFEELISGEEDSTIYGWEEENQVGFDSEKGYVDMEFVVQRISDGRFFKGKYTKGRQGDIWINDYSLEEVFRKQITEFIYE